MSEVFLFYAVVIRSLKRIIMEHRINFVIRDDLAYTIDENSLIYNLVAFGFSTEVNQDDVQNFFQPFDGQVIEELENRNFIINFKSAHMAARFLKMDKHNIEDKNCWFEVRPSDNQSFTEPKNILELCDDVLFEVFKFLSVKDQLTLSQSHKRFLNIFQTYAKNYYKVIDMWKLQAIEELPEYLVSYFFETAGTYLKTLTILILKTRVRLNGIIDHITSQCPNVENLKMLGYRNDTVSIHHFRNLLLSKQNLKILRLNTLILSDDHIDAIKTLPRLEQLSLCYCKNIIGHNLNQLTQLTKLRLEYLKDLNASSLRQALSALKNLYAFSLAIDTEDIEYVEEFLNVLNELPSLNNNLKILALTVPNIPYEFVRYLPKLTSFTFEIYEENFDYSILSQHNQLQSLIVMKYSWNLSLYEFLNAVNFKNIKKLHLPEAAREVFNISDSCLKALQSLTNLEELKMNGHHSFTNSGLVQLVEKCRQLKWLNVKRTKIGNNFLCYLLELIEENDRRPNGRLTILVYGTYIFKRDHDFPKNYLSKEFQNLVYLVFSDVISLKYYHDFDDSFDNDGNLIETPFC